MKRARNFSEPTLTVSEAELVRFASDLAAELRPGERVLLEGPMGAGKSTFARALLRAAKVATTSEGSPTFAIAHEYRVGTVRWVHADFYRLRSEEEIELTGLEEIFWDREVIVIAEWVSLFPDFSAHVEESDFPVHRIELAFTEGDVKLRQLAYTPPRSPSER